MTVEYLKKAAKTSTDDAGDVRATVQAILSEIEAGGDEAALKYAARFDKYEGSIVLTPDEIAAAAAEVPQKLKDDICFAHDCPASAPLRQIGPIEQGRISGSS